MAQQRIAIQLAACMLALAAAGAARAQDNPGVDDTGAAPVSGADWNQACLKVWNLQPPKGEALPPKLLASAGKCDAQLLYYDTLDKPSATQADWDTVRACAISNDDDAVLTMLYANGLGVKFNPALALQHACGGNNLQIDPQSVARDMMNLAEAARPASPRYDICSEATTTASMIPCGQIAERRSDHADARKLAALSQRWSIPQQAALGRLHAAAMAFAGKLGAEADDDTIATLDRVPYSIGSVRVSQKARFMLDIKQAEDGQLPAYTRAQFIALDKQLNASYRQSMEEAPDPQSQASIDSRALLDDTRETERAWLKYRDAWVDFGKARYPQVPDYAWKAWLTERRIKQLDGEGMDNADPAYPE